ncbi:MAG: flagellar export protein FliJ, partial [Proteobacteria bacterium]|nr:flagellar export protein FliJ [Pseudomonadota bacterium]
MAKFKFQLESVEKVRKMKEQKMLEALSESQRAYLEKINIKRDLLAKKQTAFDGKNGLSGQSTNVNEIRLFEDFIEGLKLRIQRADQAIIRARRFLDQAMRNYIQARKERMMIDRLREKAYEEFRLGQSRLEQKVLDDLMTMRARMNPTPVKGEEESA